MAGGRSKYHHGNLRESVLEAAHKLIEQEGVTAITLRRIAKEVGVSQNAPYSHFADKTALLDALAADGFQGLTHQMKQISNSSLTPPEYLQAIGRVYVMYALAHPELFRLMFNLQQSDKPISTHLQEVSSKSFQILQNAVAMVGECEVDDEERQIIATISAWSIVHGLSVLLAENRVFTNPSMKKLKVESIIDQSTAIFTKGLTCSCK